MQVTRSERPARAEALARTSPIRRLHAVTVVVVVVGLVVTAGLVVASAVVHDRNEDRLLGQRVHEAATVAASGIAGLQSQLAAASVAAEAGADGAQFEQVVRPLVDGHRFVSASVWPLAATDPEPSVVVGAPPELASAADRRAYLDAAAHRDTLSIRDLLDDPSRRLGYAYAIPGARSVVYFEAPLPKDRRSPIASDSAFADLDYALYLGADARPSHLLASSSGHGLGGHRTASDAVAFGDTKILVVVSPNEELGGYLLAALSWVLGAIGVLLTILAAFLAERLVRRRERAEELSDRLEEVAEENAALFASQRDVAEQLQRSLMPQSLPRFAGLESAARYQAGVVGTEVGGDWYDVLPIADDRVVFSVGDVVGRGLAAAALMASLRYSIRAYALEQIEPATILDKLSAMVETTSDGNFATVICGLLDATAGTLTVARAGHPDLLVVDHDGAHFLDAPVGPPVGVDLTRPYRSVTRDLPPTATLLAYTDGLVERRREHIDIGLERLRVAALADLPLDELVSHLVDTLVIGGDDDVALLGLHWTAADRAHAAHDGAPAPPISDGRDDAAVRAIALPSDPRAARTARGFVREALRAWQVDGSPELAELLTDELVSNVVAHVGRPMEVRVRRDGSTVRIEVEDDSTERPVLRHPDELDEHGRGILFVETLATDWGVDVHDAGKTIWFEIAVSEASESALAGD